jgi:beta-mannosidase
MTRVWHELSDAWQLEAVDRAGLPDSAVRDALPVPATVPGTVITDLLDAGLVPDPYLDENEQRLDWIGRQAWRYRCRFEASAAPGTVSELAFDGLDTLARIVLNGQEVARTANMHRRYRYDVTGVLREGENELVVEFDSPWGPSEQAAADGLPEVYSPYTHLRKMACNFGWDWGPVLVTSGIWRAVRLEQWSVARLGAVRSQITVAGGNGVVRLDADVEMASSADLDVLVTVAGVEARAPVENGRAQVEVHVPSPELWWPVGHGDQPLYGLQVELRHGGRVLDSWRKRIGFRSLVIDTTPDADGIPFIFLVNGRQIPVRGANWIPDDCFPSRVGRARIERRLDQAVRANINLIRVWGGGVFESDDFYAACDEAGLLVWQDFLFSVAPYPEIPALMAEVDLEARDNIERLMSHPSLALWNGNNENWLGWGMAEWRWKERLAGHPWGMTYYLEILPKAVAEVDPSRFYWPGSPYSGSPEAYFNDPAKGLVHLWDAWNEKDYTAYREHSARFVSEFGWQGPATMSTLTRAVHDEVLAPDSPGMVNHQKASDGNGKLVRGLIPHFELPKSFADWHFAMQLNQARALQVGIEHFRSLQPLNTGTIIWQLNDCWPVVSWAVIDGDERLKPAWYALRRSYRPKLLTFQPRPSGLALVAVDDSGADWQAELQVRRYDCDGKVLAEQLFKLSTCGLAAAEAIVDASVAQPGDPTRELLVAETTDGDRAYWYFVEDKDFAYQPADVDVEVADTADHVELTLTARVFIRDLAVLPDRVNAGAEADDMLLTLLPGESAVIRVRGISRAELEPALSFPVIRSANDLVKG